MIKLYRTNDGYESNIDDKLLVTITDHKLYFTVDVAISTVFLNKSYYTLGTSGTRCLQFRMKSLDDLCRNLKNMFFDLCEPTYTIIEHKTLPTYSPIPYTSFSNTLTFKNDLVIFTHNDVDYKLEIYNDMCIIKYLAYTPYMIDGVISLEKEEHVFTAVYVKELKEKLKYHLDLDIGDIIYA